MTDVPAGIGRVAITPRPRVSDVVTSMFDIKSCVDDCVRVAASDVTLIP